MKKAPGPTRSRGRTGKLQLQPLYDCGNADDLFNVLVIKDHKDRHLRDVVPLGCLPILIGVDLLVSDPRLVQYGIEDPTIRTRPGSEQQIAFFRRFVTAHAFGVSCGIAMERPTVCQVRSTNVIGDPVPELLCLPIVPVLHRPIVTRDPAVDLGGFTTVRADSLLTGEVTVVLADGVGRGECVIREAVVLGDLAHQVCGGLPVGELFAKERVEHGVGGVEGLQLVLNVEGGENVFGVTHGHLAPRNESIMLEANRDNTLNGVARKGHFFVKILSARTIDLNHKSFQQLRAISRQL